MSESQCVALGKLFSKEVHWIELWTFWGSALSWWENKSNTFTDKWMKIENTPEWVPQEWDLVFWGTLFWKYGHVAIFDSWNVNSMICLSQNSTGKVWDVKWDEIIAKYYSYKWVLGWYRPIKNIPAVAVSINGALEETLITKILARMPKKRKVKPNTHKKIKPFNQKTDPYCTAFASAWAWLYNHWESFTDKEIYEWATPILKWKWWVTSQIANKFASWRWGKMVTLTIFSSHAEALLDLGYALIIRTRCPSEFWTDWINDGVVDWKNYKPKEWTGHAIVLIKVKWKYKLINSWGDYEKKGKFNTYEIDAETLFKSWLIRSECFFIY